jgi:hypothetical protein
MTVYIFLNFKKLILKEDDSIGLQYYSINLDELEPAEYATSDFMTFWILSKSKNGYKPVFLNSIDPETNRNVNTMIKIEYLQQDSNWYNTEPHTYSHTEVQQCTVDDFCLHGDVKDCHEENIKAFDAWAGFSLICPEE